jgi:hypothetical protein
LSFVDVALLILDDPLRDYADLISVACSNQASSEASIANLWWGATATAS